MKKIICAILVVVMALSITACGAPPVGTADFSSPKDVVAKYFEVMKRDIGVTADNMVTFIDSDDNGAAFKEAYETTMKQGLSQIGNSDAVMNLLKAITKKMNIKILDESIDGDSATVKAEITLPDMTDLQTITMQKLQEDPTKYADLVKDTSKLMEALIPLMVEVIDSAKTTTKESSVELVKVGDKWLLTADSASTFISFN